MGGFAIFSNGVGVSGERKTRGWKKQKKSGGQAAKEQPVEQTPTTQGWQQGQARQQGVAQAITHKHSAISNKSHSN